MKQFSLIFLKAVLDQYSPYFDGQKRGATIKGIPSDIVKKTKIPTATMDLQMRYVSIVEQSDKSQFIGQVKHLIFSEYTASARRCAK